LVLNLAHIIGARHSPNSGSGLVKFMLPLCLRLSLQVNITPSVSPPSSMFLSSARPPPHLLQTELGAIHKILHLPPQTISYNLAMNFSAISGFTIRSASTAMHASMIRFALKSFSHAEHVNKVLIQTTCDCIPLSFLSCESGLPITPGWDSPAYVSRLACAMRIDNSLGAALPEFANYLSSMKRRIDRNCSISEVAIQKQIYKILMNNFQNGWNSLILKRLRDFGVGPNLVHDSDNSFEFFKLKLKRIQPHLKMLFVKTLTNGWHTSSRMHEAICLPCIFGCNALPSNCLAPIQANLPSKLIRDETAHYLACPILSGLITQASGLNHLITMHDLILGNDIHDLTGALACATSYHVYHSLKLGNLPIIQKAIETGRFGHVRALAFSTAKAFMNDFDIMSNGDILCIGFSGLKRGHVPLPLASNPRPIASNHLFDQDGDGPDFLAFVPDL